MTFGLFLVRRKRKALGAPPTEFRAWNFVLLFALAVNVYLLVLPWIPPVGGIYAGDVSFFYATYCIVGLGMYVSSLLVKPAPLLTSPHTVCSLAVSAIAYFVWIVVLPKYGKYAVRQVVDHQDDGAQNLRVVKVPLAELEAWDATHNDHGDDILDTQWKAQGNNGADADVEPVKKVY